jgi:hypothetical protein
VSYCLGDQVNDNANVNANENSDMLSMLVGQGPGPNTISINGGGGHLPRRLARMVRDRENLYRRLGEILSRLPNLEGICICLPDRLAGLREKSGSFVGFFVLETVANIRPPKLRSISVYNMAPRFSRLFDHQPEIAPFPDVYTEHLILHGESPVITPFSWAVLAVFSGIVKLSISSRRRQHDYSDGRISYSNTDSTMLPASFFPCPKNDTVSGVCHLRIRQTVPSCLTVLKLVDQEIDGCTFAHFLEYCGSTLRELQLRGVHLRVMLHISYSEEGHILVLPPLLSDIEGCCEVPPCYNGFDPLAQVLWVGIPNVMAPTFIDNNNWGKVCWLAPFIRKKAPHLQAISAEHLHYVVYSAADINVAR